MKWKERIYCGELTSSHAGREVLLMGWVDAIRDHGNILFIHLRDIQIYPLAADNRIRKGKAPLGDYAPTPCL